MSFSDHAEIGMKPPKILTVPEDVHRPLWSVMIPTYNCAKYLRQTLESVLEQDPGSKNMQIEVVDDCSTLDDPESVVSAVGKGRVAFYRKPSNEGAIANFNTCIERSQGHLVHILHGDDWVEPGFYRQLQFAFEQNPEVGICIVRTFVVDENGELATLSLRISMLESPSNQVDFMYYENPVRTPGVVVRRIQYENKGGFLPTLIHTADWEMWIRIIRSSKGMFLNKPLASYRNFPGNDTGRLAGTGENLRDHMRLAKILLAQDNKDFNYQRFMQHVMQTAKTQSRRFKMLGERTAYELNLALYRELLARQPAKRKLIEAMNGAQCKIRDVIVQLLNKAEK